MKRALFAIFFLIAFAQTATAADQAWPPNPFYLPYDSTNVGPVNFEKANLVATQLQNIYQNEFNLKKKHNYFLTVAIDWLSPYFAAFATQKPVEANFFQAVVVAWGGMVRVPEMTEFGLAATLCHELGHHFGGAPYQQEPLPDWSSSEGQSDFYAASVCLPRWFKVIDEQQKPMQFHSDIKAKCASSQACLYTAQAGYDFVRVIRNYSYQDIPQLSILQKETLVVSETLMNRYPTYQCRLDTFLSVAFAGGSAERPPCWFKK